MIAEYPAVRLQPGSDRRIRAGHLWVFSNELQDGFQTIEPGSIVQLLDHSGKFIAIGSCNPHSLIALRLLSRTRAAIDRGFFRKRLAQANDLRHALLGSGTIAYRVVYSESDGLPGLVADRYADTVVVQTLTAGMDLLLPIIVDELAELLHPRAIVAANDSPARELEGLSLSREVIQGTLHGPREFAQDGVSLLADPLGGQKTGFFLDQRMNRRMLQGFVHPGMRVLDLFCCTGAFGLYALHSGAATAHFVDSSESALELVQTAAVLNNVGRRISVEKADIFEWIKHHEERYDAVILDPPALVKSRTKVQAALRAYRDLNARAAALLKPGGLLATSSCSGLIDRASWQGCLREASEKSGRRLRIIAQGSQAPDHPILAAVPETEYLKFAIAFVD